MGEGLLPPGLDAGVTFDLAPNLQAPDGATTPGYVLLDVVLPTSASLERADRVLQHCEEFLQKAPGVRHTLALTDQPFDRLPDRLSAHRDAIENRERLILAKLQVPNMAAATLLWHAAVGRNEHLL